MADLQPAAESLLDSFMEKRKLVLFVSDRRELAKMAKEQPEPGCEAQWGRYFDAVKANAEAHAREEAVCKEMTRRKQDGSDSPMWPLFEEAFAAVKRTQKAEHAAFDAYEATVKHKRRAKDNLDGDVLAMVQASMDGATDGIQLKVSIGHLATYVAWALRGLVTEFDGFTPPLCAGCA